MGDLKDNRPQKGEVWQHTVSGGTYLIEGFTLNTITDQYDVRYTPLYECEIAEFTRQIEGHPKAFLSTNGDGTPRFKRLFTAIGYEAHLQELASL